MLNDDELIYYYRMNHECALEYLIEKYSKVIYSLIHSFNLYSYESDMEDLYQLCLIELYKAIDRYNEKREAKFKTYFYQCAKTCVLNYLTLEKNKSLYQIKNAISLDSCINEEGGNYMHEAFEDPNSTHNSILLLDIKNKEEMALRKCKDLEIKIWELRFYGLSYEEISIQCDITIKKVDNTVRKIQKLIKNIT